MENKIHLFDQYITGDLSKEEKLQFDRRITSDPAFAEDFRIYRFSLRGILSEAEQEDMEFGIAMKNISPEAFMRAIGYDDPDALACGASADDPQPLPRPAAAQERTNPFRRNLAWIASIAALLAVGFFTVIRVNVAASNRLDDVIVAYNYIPDSTRGDEALSVKDIPSLEKAYALAPADDVQLREDAGMRLAMAYLHAHERKKAKELLTEMASQFADDEDFAARCRTILSQLR